MPKHRVDYETIWETLAVPPDAFGVLTTMVPKTIVPGPAEPRFSPQSLPTIRFASSEEVADLRLSGTLGEGGMGIVYLADQVPLGREVAVKALREDRRSGVAIQALLEEAWVNGVLEHPNIAPIYTLGRSSTDGHPVIVMKRIEGTNWREVLVSGAQPLKYHLNVLIDVCNALEYAHDKGIVHRDLKPENVMIGNFGAVYLLDWGIAFTTRKDADERLPRASDEIAGTPVYMAPEMTIGDGAALGTHTDVYQLGALLHELLTGAVRHKGDALFDVMRAAYESAPVDYGASVPVELGELCNAATRPEPTDRVPSVAAFREALQLFEAHQVSTVLAEEASRRGAELRAIMDGGGEEVEQRVQTVFGECRFGFQQALKTWPQNTAASRGLEDALALMTSWELRHPDVRAAAVWLAEMKAPSAELTAELARAKRALASEAEEVEKLREDQRLDIGVRGRTIVGITIALVWGALPLVFSWQLEHGLKPDADFVLASGFLVTLFCLAIAGATWRMLSNAINRRMMYMILAVGFTIPLYRYTALQAVSDPLAIYPTEMVIFGLATACVAVVSRMRLLLAALAFFVSAVLATRFGDWTFEIIAAGDVIAGLIAVAVWGRIAAADPSQKPNDRPRPGANLPSSP